MLAKYVAALPRYNPKIAAETILRAAVYPEREVYVGTVGKYQVVIIVLMSLTYGTAWFLATLHRLFPNVCDFITRQMSFRIWRTDPGAAQDDNMHHPCEHHNNVTGSLEKKYTMNFSLYNTVKKYQGMAMSSIGNSMGWLTSKMHRSHATPQSAVQKKTQ